MEMGFQHHAQAILPVILIGQEADWLPNRSGLGGHESVKQLNKLQLQAKCLLVKVVTRFYQHLSAIKDEKDVSCCTIILTLPCDLLKRSSCFSTPGRRVKLGACYGPLKRGSLRGSSHGWGKSKSFTLISALSLRYSPPTMRKSLLGIRYTLLLKISR